MSLTTFPLLSISKKAYKIKDTINFYDIITKDPNKSPKVANKKESKNNIMLGLSNQAKTVIVVWVSKCV